MLVFAFQGLSFWRTYLSTNHVFVKTPSWTPFCLNFILILYETDRFGDPFKIQMAPKWDPKSTKWHQNGTKTVVADLPKPVPQKALLF